MTISRMKSRKEELEHCAVSGIFDLLEAAGTVAKGDPDRIGAVELAARTIREHRQQSKDLAFALQLLDFWGSEQAAADTISSPTHGISDLRRLLAPENELAEDLTMPMRVPDRTQSFLAERERVRRTFRESGATAEQVEEFERILGHDEDMLEAAQLARLLYLMKVEDSTYCFTSYFDSVNEEALRYAEAALAGQEDDVTEDD